MISCFSSPQGVVESLFNPPGCFCGAIDGVVPVALVVVVVIGGVEVELHEDRMVGVEVVVVIEGDEEKVEVVVVVVVVVVLVVVEVVVVDSCKEDSKEDKRLEDDGCGELVLDDEAAKFSNGGDKEIVESLLTEGKL